MPNEWDFESESEAPMTETAFAQGRSPGHTYTSKTFANRNEYSADFGQPSRFAYEVFDDDGTATRLIRDGEEWSVTPVDRSRTQIKVLVSREAGALVDLWIQRVPLPGAGGAVKDVLRVRRDNALRLAEFFRRLNLMEPDGADSGTRIDDETLAQLINDPAAVRLLYGSRPQELRDLIAADVEAQDVIALAGRKAALDEFRHLLGEDEYFDSQIESGKGREAVWQKYFEENPWVLGIELGSQLFTSWSDGRLEQVVAGHTFDGVGKRADALLKTSGLIKSLVFADIKHHRTPLLSADEYRPGVWSPSKDLSGGVLQSQTTVHRAVSDIGNRVSARDTGGFETGDLVYLVRPRSFLIVGSLSEFVGTGGGHHREKITSFELYRRHLQEPEVVTFDELLARAEWIVENVQR